MVEHTPTPWDIIAGDDYYITAEGYPKGFLGRFKGNDNGGYLAIVGNRPKDFGEANAAFIVKAVNNHEALVEALTDLIEAVRRDSDEGGKGISGYTAARLSDARSVLSDVGNAGSGS